LLFQQSVKKMSAACLLTPNSTDISSALCIAAASSSWIRNAAANTFAWCSADSYPLARAIAVGPAAPAFPKLGLVMMHYSVREFVG
jgi:hypothetical protein